MNAFMKLPKVRNENFYGSRQFYHDVELNIRSLSLLVIKTSPQEITQIVARNVKKTWNLKEILEIVKQELGASEARTTKPVLRW